MCKHILCFDVDGTLADANQQIHPMDREILQNIPHCLFIPSTGRPLHSLKIIFHRNGLFIGQAIPFPLILQNGAAIYDKGEALLGHYPFDHSIQESIVQILIHHKRIHHLFIGLDEVYSLYPESFGMGLVDQLAFDSAQLPGQHQEFTFSKIMCLSPQQAALDPIRSQLDALPVEKAYSITGVLEINPAGVNKSSGFEKLKLKLNLNGYSLIAVGDGENDLPLLHAADRSFAPSTSSAYICSQVDQVIETSKSGIITPILEAIGVNPISH